MTDEGDDGSTADPADAIERGSAPGDTTADESAIGGGILDVLSAELDTALLSRAAVSGVWTFVAGYVVTVLLIVLGPSRSAGAITGILNAIAFVFYSAHNVSVVSPDVTYNTLVLQAQWGNPAVPIAVFFAIPPLVLFVAGGVFTWRAFGTRATLDRVGEATLGLAVGYMFIAVLGTFVVQLDASHPSHVRALLFGLAYPIAFCLLGGLAVVGWQRLSAQE